MTVELSFRRLVHDGSISQNFLLADFLVTSQEIDFLVASFSVTVDFLVAGETAYTAATYFIVVELVLSHEFLPLFFRRNLRRNLFAFLLPTENVLTLDSDSW